MGEGEDGSSVVVPVSKADFAFQSEDHYHFYIGAPPPVTPVASHALPQYSGEFARLSFSACQPLCGTAAGLDP